MCAVARSYLLLNSLVKNEADKKLMCGFLVHVADLTGQTKSFDLSREWSLRICREFTLQVRERAAS